MGALATARQPIDALGADNFEDIRLSLAGATRRRSWAILYEGINRLQLMGRRRDARMDTKNIAAMTDAQKKARVRFKKAIEEAAKLRKKNPKLSQADAVKKAWATLYGKERAKKIGAPAKKAAKKSAPKKAAPKKAAKKCAPKKSAPGERHTDSKSHNVNIRVISGVLKTYIVLFDTGHNFETVKIQAVDMRAARAMASRIKRDDPKLKKSRTSVRLFRK